MLTNWYEGLTAMQVLAVLEGADEQERWFTWLLDQPWWEGMTMEQMWYHHHDIDTAEGEDDVLARLDEVNLTDLLNEVDEEEDWGEDFNTQYEWLCWALAGKEASSLPQGRLGHPKGKALRRWYDRRAKARIMTALLEEYRGTPSTSTMGCSDTDVSARTKDNWLEFFSDPKYIGKRASVRNRPCSCMMCSRNRKYNGITLQERLFHADASSQIRELPLIQDIDDYIDFLNAVEAIDTDTANRLHFAIEAAESQMDLIWEAHEPTWTERKEMSDRVWQLTEEEIAEYEATCLPPLR